MNLIVGRNNVGKTMFLEALRLYSQAGNWRAVRSLLVERDEYLLDEAGTGTGEEVADFPLRIESLFYRYPDGAPPSPLFEIGPVGKPENRLRIEVRWLRKVPSSGPKGATRLELLPADSLNNLADSDVLPGLTSAFQGVKDVLRFSQLNRSPWGSYTNAEVVETAFIPAKGAGERDMARWWDAISLRDAEARVYDCLRLIAPIERVNYVAAPSRVRERIAMIRLLGERVPVPLKSMGDGLGRMFQIAVAIEKARLHRRSEALVTPSPFAGGEPNGLPPTPMLLIDEVENGIHYSVQAKLWSFLISMAKLHDVQVFATTHSWDCILGLKEAVALHPDAEAQLIRLERKDGADKAVIFDQHELPIIARDEIEVR